MKMLLKSLLALLTTIFALSSAAAHAKDFYTNFNFAFEQGGYTLFEGIYSDGSTKSVTTGGGFLLGTGVLYLPDDHDFGMELNIGYKLETASASNGDVTFDRTPVDLAGVYVLGPHRLSAGLTYHVNPTYSCNVVGLCEGSVKFQNAAGLIVQYLYSMPAGGKLGGATVLGVRYTSISYEHNGYTLDGSATGFIVGWLF